jgi:hypothetical protein
LNWRAKQVFFAAALVSMTPACAPSLVTLGVAPELHRNAETSEDIVIVSVSDKRELVSSPDDGEPGLAGANREHLAPHALGRCPRTVCGLFSPEDYVLASTVSSVVETAVANGFRDAGYRVTTGSIDGSSGDSVQVRVDVLEFWIFNEPGFSGLVDRYDFKARLIVHGNVSPFKRGYEVPVEVTLNSNAVFSHNDAEAFANTKRWRLLRREASATPGMRGVRR